MKTLINIIFFLLLNLSAMAASSGFLEVGRTNLKVLTPMTAFWPSNATEIYDSLIAKGYSLGTPIRAGAGANLTIIGGTNVFSVNTNFGVVDAGYYITASGALLFTNSFNISNNAAMLVGTIATNNIGDGTITSNKLASSVLTWIASGAGAGTPLRSTAGVSQSVIGGTNVVQADTNYMASLVALQGTNTLLVNRLLATNALLSSQLTNRVLTLNGVATNLVVYGRGTNKVMVTGAGAINGGPFASCDLNGEYTWDYDNSRYVKETACGGDLWLYHPAPDSNWVFVDEIDPNGRLYADSAAFGAGVTDSYVAESGMFAPAPTVTYSGTPYELLSLDNLFGVPKEEYVLNSSPQVVSGILLSNGVITAVGSNLTSILPMNVMRLTNMLNLENWTITDSNSVLSIDVQNHLLSASGLTKFNWATLQAFDNSGLLSWDMNARVGHDTAGPVIDYEAKDLLGSWTLNGTNFGDLFSGGSATTFSYTNAGSTFTNDFGVVILNTNDFTSFTNSSLAAMQAGDALKLNRTNDFMVSPSGLIRAGIQSGNFQVGNTNGGVPLDYDGVTLAIPGYLNTNTIGATVNALTYGLVADGATDNTVALSNLLNGSSSVYLPSGTYAHTNPIRVNRPVNVFGDGETSILKYTGSSNSFALTFTTGGSTIRRLNFSYPQAGAAAAGGAISLNAVGFPAVEFCNFANVAGTPIFVSGDPDLYERSNHWSACYNTFSNCFNGITGDGANRSEYGIVNGNRMFLVQSNGLFIQSANSVVQGNNISGYKGLSGVPTSTGLRFISDNTRGHTLIVGNEFAHHKWGMWLEGINGYNGTGMSALSANYFFAGLYQVITNCTFIQINGGAIDGTTEVMLGGNTNCSINSMNISGAAIKGFTNWTVGVGVYTNLVQFPVTATSFTGSGSGHFGTLNVTGLSTNNGTTNIGALFQTGPATFYGPQTNFGNIIPSSDNTYSLGGSGRTLASAWMNQARVSSYVWFNTSGGYIYYPNDANGVRFRNASSDAWTAGVNTNEFWSNLGLMLPATNTPGVMTGNGAKLWSDGTNLCVILKSAAGKTTNKVTVTPYP